MTGMPVSICRRARQRVSCSRFANGTLLQAFYEVGIEIVAALVALETEIREHIATELAVHAIDLDVDVGVGWAAGYHRP